MARRNIASSIALGGVLAALAVVIMAMGTLIPVATYVCPVLCCMLLQFVLLSCGRRIAWAWYAAVAILSALLAVVMMFGMLPAALFEAQAADWMEEYIQKVVDWGVMRGDVSGNLNAGKTITRAEFVTMVNRAFGYTGSISRAFFC